MAAYGKTDAMIVHTADPMNAETPRGSLAEHHVTPVDRFYVRNHGPVPESDPETWTLRIDGLVGRPLTLSSADLRALPRHEVAAAALADVLALARPERDAAHVGFVGADLSTEAQPSQPFGGSVPLEKGLRGEVLLAYEMNGGPLPTVHGAPVRVVVPGYIGARSVKWLERVELRSAPWAGWFQDVVYRLLEPGQEPGPGVGMALGEVALNAEILAPDDGARVPAGTVELRGYAFAGGERHVARVDLSADGGATWTSAELTHDLGRWAWRLWRGVLRLDPGDHELVVRAWDSAAASQPEHPGPLWNPKGYVNNAWGRITVHAS